MQSILFPLVQTACSCTCIQQCHNGKSTVLHVRHATPNHTWWYSTLLNISKTTTVCLECNLYQLWENMVYYVILYIVHDVINIIKIICLIIIIKSMICSRAFVEYLKGIFFHISLTNERFQAFHILSCRKSPNFPFIPTCVKWIVTKI